MIKIDVFIKEKNLKKYISNPKKYLNNQVQKIKLNNYLMPRTINISVLLTGNEDIKKLNAKFRKKNKTTDVLSFPFYSPKEIKKKLKSKKQLYLGDIIINLNKIEKKNNKFKKEFIKLWVHGFVHLLGYKHYKNKDFFKMEKMEKTIINQLVC